MMTCNFHIQFLLLMFNNNIHDMNILPFLSLSLNTKLLPSVTILMENVTFVSVSLVL